MTRKILGISAAYLALSALALVIISGALTVLVLGPKITGFNAVSNQDFSVASLSANPELVSTARAEIGDELLSALDCSSFSPAERRPGDNCLPGLMSSLQNTNSPIPEKALFMVPIWQRAAKRYGLPWQLLAAVAGARSNFATVSCQSDQGAGMYRFYPKMWRRYGVDAGSMVLKRRGTDCWQVLTAGPDSKAREAKRLKPKMPVVSAPLERLPPPGKKASPAANPYDPVDATFTLAHFIAQNGGLQSKKWNYSGAGPKQCTTEASDGPVWYPPELDLGYGAGARVGYNARLDIPRDIALLAAKYRSKSGKYRPRRDPDKNYSPMPKKDIVRILTAVWSAFGVRGQELRNKVTLNYAQIGLESGGRPYILQGYIGDVNDNNPAGGLMQFIPFTFNHWKVDGFNDRFNPLDNILAAVNAQVNGPYPTLDGSSGWSPPFSRNPYAQGGRSRLVGASETSGKRIARRPYRGPAQVDPISRALRQQRPGYPNSDCYLAIVHNWYREIIANPPEEALITGPLRQRIVKIAQAEHKKGVAESGGDNVPRYTKSGQIAPYNISAAWCQAFAAWIWYQAGFKQVAKVPGMMSSSGLALPSYTGTVSAAARAKQYGMTFKTKNPLPGDFIFWGSNHVEIVEKVKNGRVISTIGGNTSNAVTRVSPPSSGYTHFVSPPAKAGKSTYNFAPSDGSQEKRLQKLLKDLPVRAGIVDTQGRETTSVGELSSSPAGETIELPWLKVGKQRRVADRQLRFMLLTPGPASRRPVLSALGPKRADYLKAALRPAPGAGIFSGQGYGATIWPAAAANRLAIDLAQNKKYRRLLAITRTTVKPWKYRISSRSSGRDYRRKWLFRSTYFSGQRARTIIVASDNYRQGQQAVRRLAAWR